VNPSQLLGDQGLGRIRVEARPSSRVNGIGQLRSTPAGFHRSVEEMASARVAATWSSGEQGDMFCLQVEAWATKRGQTEGRLPRNPRAAGPPHAVRL
jgi:hypothetical protein